MKRFTKFPRFDKIYWKIKKKRLTLNTTDMTRRGEGTAQNIVFLFIISSFFFFFLNRKQHSFILQFQPNQTNPKPIPSGAASFY